MNESPISDQGNILSDEDKKRVRDKLKHVVYVMDGNRSWAKEKYGTKTPAIVGHKAGAKNAKKMTEIANEKGIKHLTLWALSTDNLIKRCSDEVNNIIGIINNIELFFGEMMDAGLRLNTIGDLSKLPEKSQNILQGVMEKTKNNVGIILTLGLIYGGQDEIVRGINKKNGLENKRIRLHNEKKRRIIEYVLKGGDVNLLKEIDDLTEITDLDIDSFRKYLDTSFLPKPDLIIRTGGHKRHSGALLFDSEYSQYFFSDKNWPEFDEEELDRAIKEFLLSKRKFGK